MTTQVLLLDRREPLRNERPNAFESEKSQIITMGQIIGMISMVLGSIIEAIEKSGSVGKNFLETNLRIMKDSAFFAKKAQLHKAGGMKAAAIIGIAIAGVGMGASVGSVGQVAKNSSKMQKIQSAPLTQPAKLAQAKPGNAGLGNFQANAVDRNGVASMPAGQAVGGGGRVRFVPAKQQEVSKGEKVLHGKDKNATSYASDAERERALKIQGELNKKTDRYAALASTFNPQTLPAGNLVQASKEEKAASVQEASDTTRAVSGAINTVQSENGSFYGALSGLMEKWGITSLVMQTMLAASQWR